MSDPEDKQKALEEVFGSDLELSSDDDADGAIPRRSPAPSAGSKPPPKKKVPALLSGTDDEDDAEPASSRGQRAREEEDDDGEAKKKKTPRKRREERGAAAGRKGKSKGKGTDGEAEVPKEVEEGTKRKKRLLSKMGGGSDDDDDDEGAEQEKEAGLFDGDDDEKDEIEPAPKKRARPADRDLEDAAGSGGDAGDAPAAPSALARSRSYFDRQFEKHKQARRRKHEVPQKVMESHVVDFLVAMAQARDMDIKAYKAGKPATEKLKMMPEVERMLRRSDYRECLLDNRLLSILRAWLDPMPDGTLPNLTIRTRLLELLQDFPVTEEWPDRLRSSNGLGKVINFLSKKDPHEPNQRLAKKLIENWSRPIFETTTDFRSLNQEYERVEFDPSRPRGREADAPASTGVMDKATEALRQKRQELAAGYLKTRAGVPDKVIFNFRRMPESTIQVDERAFKQRETAKDKKLEKAVKGMRSSFKKGARAVNVSVEGKHV